jgi:ABC-type amino acid transport system permease subunit
MTPLPPERVVDFLSLLVAGIAVNFEIAGIAIAAGIAVGIPFALLRPRGGIGGRLAVGMIGLMRAAPTFVVMFFLLNALPRDAGLPPLSGVMIVALSLLPYSAAYVADSGADAMQQLRAGSHLGALLLLPNLMRAFFVLVMSSGAAAAIGVPEGISVILRHAELFPSLGGKFVFFAIGVVAFAVPLQAGFAAVRLLQRRLARTLGRNWVEEPAPRAS